MATAVVGAGAPSLDGWLPRLLVVLFPLRRALTFVDIVTSVIRLFESLALVMEYIALSVPVRLHSCACRL